MNPNFWRTERGRLIREFVDHQSTEKGMSLETAERYRSYLREFCTWGRGRSGSVLTTKEHHVQRYLDLLDERGCDGRTRAENISSLRQFFLYFISDGRMSWNPMRGIHTPASRKMYTAKAEGKAFSKTDTIAVDQASQALIARFRTYLKAERAMSQHSVESYGRDARDFCRWLKRPITEAVRNDVRAFQADQLHSGCSARSAARRLSALRHLYQYLLNTEEVKTDPTVGVPFPKTWKVLPKSIGVSEVDAMVESLDASPFGVRDRALVLTFFAAGLRVSELISLKLADLDLEDCFLTVRRGKFGKDRIAPLNPVAVAALKTYLETLRAQLLQGLVRREHLAEDAFPQQVFLGQWGRPLTRQMVFYLVNDLSERTIGKRISPHWLRHSFATAVIENGADARAVQAMLGHVDIKGLDVYVHLDTRALRNAYDSTHPRARRNRVERNSAIPAVA